jgi:hypothetical protein
MKNKLMLATVLLLFIVLYPLIISPALQNNRPLSEPSAIGIVDYGIGPNGSYSYSTKEVMGIVNIFDLYVYGIVLNNKTIINHTVNLELNAFLKLYTKNNIQIFRLRNIVTIDTENDIYLVKIMDRIYNVTEPYSTINSTFIKGKGNVTIDEVKRNVYESQINLNPIPIRLYDIVLGITLKQIHNGKPMIVFYLSTHGTNNVSYDNITFLENMSDYEIVIDGSKNINLGNTNTTYDLELVMAGPKINSTSIITSSDVSMKLLFWNGHNFQAVPNAYKVGIADSFVEGVSETFNTSLAGEIYTKIVNSILNKTFINRLYTINDLSKLIVILPNNINNGSILISDFKEVDQYDIYFQGNEAIILLSPGSYYIMIPYGEGLLNYGNITLKAGETLVFNITRLTLIPITFKLKLIGGGNPSINLQYVSFGIIHEIKLNSTPITIFMDRYSFWALDSIINGSNGERWVTLTPYGFVNGSNSLSLLSENESIINVIKNNTIEISYYHQFLVSINLKNYPFITNIIFQQYGIVREARFMLSASLWVDALSNIKLSKYFQENGERWILYNNSIIVKAPENVSFNYIHEYYININSKFPVYAVYNNTNISLTSGWYQENTYVRVLNTIHNISPYERYISQGVTILVNSPKNITILWIPQYLVNINGVKNWYNNGSVIELNSSTPILYDSIWIGSYNVSDGHSIVVNKPITEYSIQEISSEFITLLWLIISIITLIIVYIKSK